MSSNKNGVMSIVSKTGERIPVYMDSNGQIVTKDAFGNRVSFIDTMAPP
jgi:hypothetical protein